MLKKITIVFTLTLIFTALSINAQAAIYDHFTDIDASIALWDVYDDGISSYDASGTGSVDIRAFTSDYLFFMFTYESFAGDFDTVMRYENWLYDAQLIGYEEYLAEIGLMVASDHNFSDSMYIGRSTDVDSGQGLYFSGSDSSASYYEETAPTTDTSGLLRIARTGDVLTTYYSSDDGSTWMELYSETGNLPDLFFVGVLAYSGEADYCYYRADVDYVDITQGQPIPEPMTLVLLGSLATGLFSVAGFRKKK
jgi:hypothetical protein